MNKKFKKKKDKITTQIYNNQLARSEFFDFLSFTTIVTNNFNECSER